MTTGNSKFEGFSDTWETNVKLDLQLEHKLLE